MIYQIIALFIMLCFYSVYIGKMIRQRKRNIQTDQMAKGNKPKKVYISELIMKTATYSVVVAEVVSIIWGQAMLSFWPRLIGIILSCTGTIVFTTAVYTMRDSWRAGIPESDQTTIITNGIYKYSRNPAFLGFDLVYLGILLIFFNYVLLAFSLWAIIMFHMQILQEEIFLPTAFGQDYNIYKAKVCRYLGRRRS